MVWLSLMPPYCVSLFTVAFLIQDISTGFGIASVSVCFHDGGTYLSLTGLLMVAVIGEVIM